MRECQNHNLVADNLIRQREWEAIENGDSSIDPVLPLLCGLRELPDEIDYGVDLIFELGAEARLP